MVNDIGPKLLRYGLGLVLLWFGFSNIFSQDFAGYVPSWATNILPLNVLLITTGIVEVVLGLLLIIGLFTRIASFIVFLHLLVITFSVGYNEIAVRDFGLTISSLALFFISPDDWCLDKK